MVNADFRVRPQLDPHHPVDLCNSCGLTRHVEIIQKREQPLPVLQLSCDRPQCPLLTQAEQQRHQCVALLTTFSLTDGADTVSKRSLDCLTTGTRLKARDIRLVAQRTVATATRIVRLATFDRAGASPDNRKVICCTSIPRQVIVSKNPGIDHSATQL